MRRFDVCRLKGDPNRLVVVLQHDVAGDLNTRLVAPLADAAGRHPITHIRVPAVVNGTAMEVQVDRMAAVETRVLGPAVGSLADRQHDLKNAVDFLLLGP